MMSQSLILVVAEKVKSRQELGAQSVRIMWYSGGILAEWRVLPPVGLGTSVSIWLSWAIFTVLIDQEIGL